MKAHRTIFLAAVSLMLSLDRVPSWAGPPNPTLSDEKGNTAGGSNTLEDATDQALGNTGFGFGVLSAVTAGDENTGIGFGALGSTTSSRNTGSGAHALQANITGDDNTADGSGALGANTVGNRNTASGSFALTSSTGDGNTAVGFQSLVQLESGKSNIALGDKAGFNLESGKKNIYIGNLGEAVESKTIRIGQIQTRTFVAGIVGTAVSGSPVLIDGAGKLGIQASSARYKRDIRTMGEASRRLLELRPVTFRYKQDPKAERQYGLVAEEVGAVYPELVTRGAKGVVESVRYQELAPMLLNELQRQERELSELRAENQRLHAELAAMRGRNDAVAARLERLERSTAGVAPVSMQQMAAE